LREAIDVTQAVDQTMLVELMTAGLQPELIARVANACAAAYARGLIDGTPQRTKGAQRQARYRERHAVTPAPEVILHDAASRTHETSRHDMVRDAPTALLTMRPEEKMRLGKKNGV
jgi:hypothetical protein